MYAKVCEIDSINEYLTGANTLMVY
jgi:hypothetical protein